jgi:hypothetical protein
MLDSRLYAFAPDVDRGRFLDERVRRLLAASLGHVFAAVEDHVSVDRVAAARLLRRIRRTRVDPGLMALYTELVSAVADNELDAIEGLLGQLLALPAPTTDSVAIVTLSDEALGTQQAARYHRLLNDDAELEFPAGPVAAAEHARAAQGIMSGLALLQAHVPELAGEILALVNQLVLVESKVDPNDKEALVFDGASSFYLWGALLLNAERLSDPLQIAAALTHEAAHSLLFGLTLGSPLVSNGEEERYDSPLRHDPRPMDGLVHATYVLARMTWCMRSLAQSSGLSEAQRERAQAEATKYQRDYQQGYAVVRDHARFTPIGQAAFTAAAEFMATLDA